MVGGDRTRTSIRKMSKRIEEAEESEFTESELNVKKKLCFIKRNVYLEETMKKKEDHGIFCSCSLTPGSSNVCGIDCACGMLLSTCSSSCKCGSECANKPFQQRRIKKMKLVETEKCGIGIVAGEDIASGEFIVEYVGEVINGKTVDDRLWMSKHQAATNFYLCEINSNMVIDATYKGNKSRYINHSCSPNTELQKWISDGELRVSIFATRAIAKGEPLTYDYQFEQYGVDQACYCGAECCRKLLGAKRTKTVIPKARKQTSKKPKGKPRGKRAHG